MDRRRRPRKAKSTGDGSKKTEPLTKTRLRRGQIAREKNYPPHCPEIIDFLPAVHGDAEDLLCDLSEEEMTVEDRPGDPPIGPEPI
ncbi:hypothetical protein AMJ85_05380 [candidate division BRC1 bacterium SM23_51]|nr:MAG: hypothetical protein AMJ85_05380 [candidate division BRC1 bacterium SM23_51]